MRRPRTVVIAGPLETPLQRVLGAQLGAFSATRMPSTVCGCCSARASPRSRASPAAPFHADQRAERLRAGDVARAYHPLLERRVRVEHWANAQHQGVAAARNMLGAQVAYDRLPYFPSDQYDVGMEYNGQSAAWDDVVIRGDLAGREFIAFWLRNNRVSAAMNVNVWDMTPDIQALIRTEAPVDAGRLADTAVALGDLLAAAARDA